MYLEDEQKAKYKVMSRPVCERYCKQTHQASAMIISIKSKHDTVKPKLTRTEKNKVRYILYLSFDDCEVEDDPDFCMSFEDGKRVADFVNAPYDEVDKIIVQCDGGISRSAGVAAAIMRVKEGDDWPIFNNSKKHPNMTSYLRTLKGFGYI